MPNCSLCLLTDCLLPAALMDTGWAPYWPCLLFALPADRRLPAFLRYFIPICFPLSIAMPVLLLFVHGYQCQAFCFITLTALICIGPLQNFSEDSLQGAQPRVEQGNYLATRITLPNPCTFNVSPFRVQIFQLIQLLPSNTFQNHAVFLPGREEGIGQ
jgi:hypothetical protein